LCPEDFKDGDRVRHVNRDEWGTVKIDGKGHVVVTFDKPNSRGHKSVVIFDANWFKVYPNGLERRRD
jgi:hypothetical protein